MDRHSLADRSRPYRGVQPPTRAPGAEHRSSTRRRAAGRSACVVAGKLAATCPSAASWATQMLARPMHEPIQNQFDLSKPDLPDILGTTQEYVRARPADGEVAGYTDSLAAVLMARFGMAVVTARKTDASGN